MTLESQKIAILTANGVNEREVSSFQRAVIQKRCFPKVIGAGSRLITAWAGSGWGYNFAVDEPISEALGSDYDVLYIPGGERAVTLLQGTEHTKRIMNAFLAAGKPMVVMSESVALFDFFGLSYEGKDSVMVVDAHDADTDFEAAMTSLVDFIENFGKNTLEQQAA